MLHSRYCSDSSTTGRERTASAKVPAEVTCCRSASSAAVTPRFSASPSHVACCGWSSTSARNTNAQAIAGSPSMMNISRQLVASTR